MDIVGSNIGRDDSLEKILMLGKIEDKRRGWQSMSWLDSTTNAMNLSLSKLQEIVKDREAGHAAVLGMGLQEAQQDLATEQPLQTLGQYWSMAC